MGLCELRMAYRNRIQSRRLSDSLGLRLEKASSGTARKTVGSRLPRLPAAWASWRFPKDGRFVFTCAVQNGGHVIEEALWDAVYGKELGSHPRVSAR